MAKQEVTDILSDSLVPSGRNAWRKWLRANHNRQQEVWLVIRKTGSPVTGISLSDAVEEAICYGWIDGKMRSVDSERYVLRFTPRKPGSIWSKLNKEKAEALIRSGRIAQSGLQKIAEARQNGNWDAAYSAKKKQTRQRRITEVVLRAKRNIKPGA